MRIRRASFVVLILAAAVVALPGGAAMRVRDVARAAPVPAGVAARPFIKHVVVIVQENRSFDNFFGGPAPSPSPSAGAPSPYPNADATWPPGVGKNMVATAIDDNGADGGHDAWACVNQPTPNGRFTTAQWQAVAANAIPPSVCQSHDYSFFRYVPQAQRTIYWQIAKSYALGDAFFAATNSASYPPHQFIVAGDASFLVSGTPAYNEREWWIADQPSSNCFSTGPGSAPVVGPDVFSTTVPTVDNRNGCYDRPTYADRLNATNTSWSHYTTAMPLSDLGVFDGFINNVTWHRASHILRGGHFLPATQVLSDAKAGNLPQFAWVKPPCIKQSDHPGQGGHNGPNWVGSVINAIGGSRDWNSTVIFVIWDDWGGFYDHVVPPAPPPWQLGRGVRIPFLVISPYLARRGEVVHTTGHPGSIMRFVNDLYGTEPLTAFDRDAPDLGGWFAFNRSLSGTAFQPVKGAVDTPWDDAMCKGSRAIVPVDS